MVSGFFYLSASLSTPPLTQHQESAYIIPLQHLPIQTAALAIITSLAVYASYRILQPFLAPLAWATALALLVHPFYRSLTERLRQRGLAAGVVTVTVGITLVVPSIWVAHSLISAALSGVDTIIPTSLPDVWQKLLHDNPRIAQAVLAFQKLFRLSDAISRAEQFIGDHAQHLVGSSIRAVFHAVLTLFILFFFLRDSSAFLEALKQRIPLSPTDTDSVVERIHDTVHAAFFGMVAVAMLQGFLGSVLLWWLHLPGIVVWGTIMALLALVPYLGAFVVWIPVAFFLALQGDWYRAAVTTVWGLFVIGLADNFLYPYLVGKRLHYHPLVVFFFLLGGVMVFGTAGVVLGPILLATTERLVWIWQRRDS
jgi:predicted PurR-regulated permease PerM